MREKENTYIANALTRDMSRASWWYKNKRLINLIHKSSIPRLKCLCWTRAANIIVPSALTFVYHWCNSHILIGSIWSNSVVPHYKFLSPDSRWIGIHPHELSFREVGFQHKVISSFILFWKHLQRGIVWLGCSPSWRIWLCQRLPFFS